ncbi:MAG: hypothetical protein ABRQ39_19950 [Candidatus Eremiobacterota bacterium]
MKIKVLLTVIIITLITIAIICGCGGGSDTTQSVSLITPTPNYTDTGDTAYITVSVKWPELGKNGSMSTVSEDGKEISKSSIPDNAQIIDIYILDYSAEPMPTEVPWEKVLAAGNIHRGEDKKIIPVKIIGQPTPGAPNQGSTGPPPAIRVKIFAEAFASYDYSTDKRGIQVARTDNPNKLDPIPLEVGNQKVHIKLLTDYSLTTTATEIQTARSIIASDTGSSNEYDINANLQLMYGTPFPVSTVIPDPSGKTSEPIEGQTVKFKVIQGSGTLDSDQAQTDPNGDCKVHFTSNETIDNTIIQAIYQYDPDDPNTIITADVLLNTVYLTPSDINIYPDVTVDFNVKIVPEPNLPVGEKLIYKWENTAQYGHISENETAPSYNDNFESEKDTVFYTANNSIKGTDTITVKIYRQKSDNSMSYMGEKSSTVNVDYQGSGKIIYSNTLNEEIWIVNLDKIPPEHKYFTKNSEYNGEEAIPYPLWADRNYNSVIATSVDIEYPPGSEPVFHTLIGSMAGTNFTSLLKLLHHQFAGIIGGNGEPGKIAAYAVNHMGPPLDIFLGVIDSEGNEFLMLPYSWDTDPIFASFGPNNMFVFSNNNYVGIYKRISNTSFVPLIQGVNAYPSISPDGRYIAYLNFNSDKPVLYLYNTSTQEQIKLADYCGYNRCGWSADSKYIVFYRDIIVNYELIGSKIYTIDTSTHKEILLMNKGGTTPGWASF